MAAAPFVGRTEERARLDARVAQAPTRGAAVLVLGGPGIGKTTLVDAVATEAAAQEMTVLRTTGVPSESQVPFAGLHQLLLPVLHVADQLPGPQERAVLTAIGRLDAEVAEAVDVALASLSLLREAAAKGPLLVIAEDLHWLDRPSADALAFVGRRLEHDPIVLVATSREPPVGAIGEADLEVLELGPLEPEDAEAVVTAAAPDLDPSLRPRLLSEAEGNPLALVELAREWQRRPPGAMPGEPVPVTTQLRATFGTRLDALPAATRAALLVAALDDGLTVAEVLTTASAVGDRPVTEEDLGPAVADRLVELDGFQLRFRHPLVRAALYDQAQPAARRTTHAELARTLTDTDRAVWHRAAALQGPDDDVAMALTEAARRARRRGAIAVAVAALERAADVTRDPAERGTRLLDAADLAVDLGRSDLVGHLVHAAEPLSLSPIDRARASWRRRLLDPGIWRDIGQVRQLTEVAEQMAAAGHVDTALDALTTVGVFCWWTNFDEDRRQLVVEALDRVPADPDDPRRLAILAMAAPIDRGVEVVGRLRSLVPDASAGPSDLLLLASAAGNLGHPELAAEIVDAAMPAMRSQGLQSVLSSALTSRAWTAWFLGDNQRAGALAIEGERVASRAGRPSNAAMARLIEAALAAIRGDTDEARRIVSEVEALCRTLGAEPILDLATSVGILVELSDRRPDAAWDQARTMLRPGEVSASVAYNQGGISLYADAAAESGHQAEGRIVVEEVAALAARSGSDALRIGVAYARARLAGDADVDAAVPAAFASDLARSPFAHARLQLAHGAWLRRQRRISDSRVPLRAARDTFDALGASAWGDRARQELRATGEASRQRAPAAVDQLTPQELEIARLAADGMTNREIGQQLYVSHRTVGSHLSRVYPKLGIRSRVELGRALATPGPSDP